MTTIARWATAAVTLLPGLALAASDDFYTTSDYSGDAGAGALALFGGLFIGFWILMLVGFVIWIWMLIDVFRRDFTNPNDKTLWAVIVIIFGAPGAIIYYFFGRNKGTIGGSSVAPSASPAPATPAPPAPPAPSAPPAPVAPAATPPDLAAPALSKKKTTKKG